MDNTLYDASGTPFQQAQADYTKPTAPLGGFQGNTPGFDISAPKTPMPMPTNTGGLPVLSQLQQRIQGMIGGLGTPQIGQPLGTVPPPPNGAPGAPTAPTGAPTGTPATGTPVRSVIPTPYGAGAPATAAPPVTPVGLMEALGRSGVDMAPLQNYTAMIDNLLAGKGGVPGTKIGDYTNPGGEQMAMNFQGLPNYGNPVPQALVTPQAPQTPTTPTTPAAPITPTYSAGQDMGNGMTANPGGAGFNPGGTANPSGQAADSRTSPYGTGIPQPAFAPKGPQYGPNGTLGLEDLGLSGLSESDQRFLAGLGYYFNPLSYDAWNNAKNWGVPGVPQDWNQVAMQNLQAQLGQ